MSLTGQTHRRRGVHFRVVGHEVAHCRQVAQRTADQAAGGVHHRSSPRVAAFPEREVFLEGVMGFGGCCLGCLVAGGYV